MPLQIDDDHVRLGEGVLGRLAAVRRAEILFRGELDAEERGPPGSTASSRACWPCR